MKKNIFKENFALLNKNIQRHNLLMIVASTIISIMAVLLTIYWQYDLNDISELVDNAYLAGSVFFLVISVCLTALLIVSRFIKFKSNILAIALHIYVFLLITWCTINCILDLEFGFTPVGYLLVFTLIAGLFVVEPLFFGIVITSSVVAVIVFVLRDGAAFFSGTAQVENYINFFAFIGIIILVAGEHYAMTINNFRVEKRLEQLTYYDDLTGLLNERSYLMAIEELDEQIKNKELTEYAVILMDLNNLKATNDAYGHRYGCHLVVRCGHTLPNYFKNSKLFHVGGDEFVAIVTGEDYDNFDELFKKFSEDLSYSLVEFEGQELIFSIAHGYAKYEEGAKYKDILQKADKAMYANKKMLKEKYGMASR